MRDAREYETLLLGHTGLQHAFFDNEGRPVKFKPGTTLTLTGMISDGADEDGGANYHKLIADDYGGLTREGDPTVIHLGQVTLGAEAHVDSVPR